jgi:hypothetical protein
MKRHIPIAFALLFLALATSNAMAQPGGGRGRGPRGGSGEAMLLQQASVQKELKLSDEQIQQVTALAAKQRETFSALGDLDPEERRQKVAEAQQAQRAELAKILAADQAQRLKQIAWQQAGPQALANPEVATALALSDEQKQAVETAQNEMREQMRAVFAGGPGGDRETARAKMAEIQKAATEKLDQVLKPEQQTKFKELLGTPFTGEIQRPSFRGRRPRGPAAEESTQAARQPFFQQTSFKEGDDDKDKDKPKIDKKKEGKKKVSHGDADQRQAKKRRNHGEHKKLAAAHRHGKHHNARHPHHRASGHWARHRSGPNAEVWARVAHAMRHRPTRGYHLGAQPRMHDFRHHPEGHAMAFHRFDEARRWSHGPGQLERHFTEHRPHGQTAPDHRAPDALAHGHRGFHHGHGPAAHFAQHHRSHGRNHFASWRMLDDRESHPEGMRHEGHGFRSQPPRRPPAPPRTPEMRRSEAGGPPTHLTANERANDRYAQRDRLEQLERSLARLAEQVEQLRESLRH